MCVSVVGSGNLFWSNFGGDRRVADFWWMVLCGNGGMREVWREREIERERTECLGLGDDGEKFFFLIKRRYGKV